MLEGFHVANGLFFDLLPSGHVRIRQVSQASGYNKINAPWEDRPVKVIAKIDGDTWESIVWEMAGGEKEKGDEEKEAEVIKLSSASPDPSLPRLSTNA